MTTAMEETEKGYRFVTTTNWPDGTEQRPALEAYDGNARKKDVKHGPKTR